MTLAARTAAPLPIGASLEQGWRAFRRAPRVFMGFTLLGGSGQLVGQLVQNQAGDALAQGGEPIPLLLALTLAGMALSLASSLWLNVGLMRGAWIALADGRPRLADLARCSRPAMLRLLAMGLLLLLLNLLILITAGLAAGLASLIRPSLGLLPLLAGAGSLLFIAVGQMLHLPLTVIGGLRPVPAFRSGQSMARAQWGRLCALAVLLGLIVLLGLLLLGAGLLAAWPVVVCSLAAAYRHLFGPEDRAGLIGGP